MDDDWDALAPTFDDEPDHGLRDPAVREAWRSLLVEVLPPAPAVIADLACGTGSLSALLVEEGHRVTGVDRAPAMLDLARTKATGATFLEGDVTDPPLPEGELDVVLARHVLFALPDPGGVLGRWTRLLRPGGRLVLIEGFWLTGSGLHAEELVRLVRLHREEVEFRHLGADTALWGRTVEDERYLVLSRR